MKVVGLLEVLIMGFSKSPERIKFLRVWHSIMHYMNNHYEHEEIEDVRRIFLYCSKPFKSSHKGRQEDKG